jgi:hypothetical protein
MARQPSSRRSGPATEAVRRRRPHISGVAPRHDEPDRFRAIASWRSCRVGLGHAARQDWDKIARLLKPVYTAPTEEAALNRFAEFADDRGRKYPAIVKLWENAWEEFTPFLRSVTPLVDSPAQLPRGPGCWLGARELGE